MKLLNGDERIIPDVLHILGLAKNLFSVRQLDKAGGEVRIKAGISTLVNKFGETIATCKLNPDLYELGRTITCNNQQIAIPATTTLNKANLWHLRLGHINQYRLKEIQTMAKGIDYFNKKEITLCQPCIEGKQHKEKFP